MFHFEYQKSVKLISLYCTVGVKCTYYLFVEQVTVMVEFNLNSMAKPLYRYEIYIYQI